MFEKYGFEENLVDMSGGMSDEEIAKFWANFIADKVPHFKLSPFSFCTSGFLQTGQTSISSKSWGIMPDILPPSEAQFTTEAQSHRGSFFENFFKFSGFLCDSVPLWYRVSGLTMHPLSVYIL